MGFKRADGKDVRGAARRVSVISTHPCSSPFRRTGADLCSRVEGASAVARRRPLRQTRSAIRDGHSRSHRAPGPARSARSPRLGWGSRRRGVCGALRHGAKSCRRVEGVTKSAFTEHRPLVGRRSAMPPPGGPEGVSGRKLVRAPSPSSGSPPSTPASDRRPCSISRRPPGPAGPDGRPLGGGITLRPLAERLRRRPSSSGRLLHLYIYDLGGSRWGPSRGGDGAYGPYRLGPPNRRFWRRRSPATTFIRTAWGAGHRGISRWCATPGRPSQGTDEPRSASFFRAAEVSPARGALGTACSRGARCSDALPGTGWGQVGGDHVETRAAASGRTVDPARGRVRPRRVVARLGAAGG